MREYNCSFWRCVIPARALSKSGHSVRIINIDEWANRSENAERMSEEADIIYIQRNLFANVLSEIFYWKNRGKVVSVDIDDAYKYMTQASGSPSYEFWINSRVPIDNNSYRTLSPSPMTSLELGVGMLNALTSPSKLICEDWAEYARTYWFPNYLDLSLYRINRTIYHPPGRIIIGWGGSMTHIASWKFSGLTDAIEQICKEYNQVDVHILGDPRIGKEIDILPSRKYLREWSHISVFSERMNIFDIGVVPLSGEYDRRRSWIKAAEYTVMGIPWIGTDSEPTRDIPTGRRVENKAEEWYKALKHYITNLEGIREIAEKNMVEWRPLLAVDSNVNHLERVLENIISEYERA